MTQNKYCPECDHINLNSAKFCSECGHDLASDSKSLESQNCKECGQENNKEARKKPQPTFSFSKYPILLIIGGLILLFIFIDNNDKEAPTGEYSPVQPTSQDFPLERNVIEVASKFTCSCGSCGEEALETCICGTAEQERNFIRQELQSGKSVSQAITVLNARYGHLKPEFADKIEGGGLNLDFSAQQQNDIFSQITSSASGSNNRIATDQDREEVFSHFECPCGQCGISKLHDCLCQHPRGATEVKLFVDSEIDNGKYTIAELIDMVDKKYGHKIR